MNENKSLDLEDEAYSLSLESLQISDEKSKCIYRVVLVNQHGDRILDSLIKPTLSEEVIMKNKDQLKRKLLSLALDVGPNIEDVKQVILHLIANKKLVGYHLIMKLTDLGLINYYMMPKDIISLKFASISIDESH